MRNEGAFLLEWVVWYRLLGFTDIVAVTNDCTDRSGLLLAALQAAGWVRHLDCDIKAGQAGITPAKLRAATALPEVRGADLALVCDVDEFLVIHAGQGLLADLCQAAGEDWLGLSINWRVFGTGGAESYADLPVHRQFQSCLRPEARLNGWIKSLFRFPGLWKRLRAHGPQGPDLDRIAALTGRGWGGEGGWRWCSPAGRSIAAWRPDGPYVQCLPAPQIDHSVAQMNHYMLRSLETFGLKAGTVSPTAGADRYTWDYFQRANRAEATDHGALAHAARFDALWHQALALPGVARAHDLCCADHVAAICAQAGRLPEDDPRHRQFLARAAGRAG